MRMCGVWCVVCGGRGVFMCVCVCERVWESVLNNIMLQVCQCVFMVVWVYPRKHFTSSTN